MNRRALRFSIHRQGGDNTAAFAFAGGRPGPTLFSLAEIGMGINLGLK